ncbi:MAG: glutaredoxin family protein [Ktedonobacteraceae bacterium]|nr:glutaredoxin family protein [Ktedonobacteraceae bacterium]
MGSTQSPAPLRVTFYTKAGCHLCEDARDMLDEIATQKTYELTEIDIRRDPEIFEQYRYRIPVIVINETLVAEGRIEYSELLDAFDSI